jgi:hypothetical protein|tara:strand:+ start:228 stop:629 length:402 start_codon:yes stop_codon:yes gene_type:complete
MATTTATIILASTDLLSDELALTTSATLTGAGNSTGVTNTSGLSRKTVSGSHAQYTLFDGTDYTADKAHKLYLKNISTTAAEYFLVTINGEDLGRIYAGDWALIPWSAHDADNDIKIDPSANDMTLEYMLFVD